MLLVCPCLNVKIIVNSRNEDVDKNIQNDLNDLIQINTNDFTQYDNNGHTNTVNIEYKQLVGVIEQNNYSIIKCLSCNLFTHIVSSSNKLVVNNNMIQNENEIENIKKSENYSPFFRIALKKDMDMIWDKDLKTAVCNDELTRFPEIIEEQAKLYLNSERAKIEEMVKRHQYEYERNYNVLENRTKIEMNVFNSKLHGILNEKQPKFLTKKTESTIINEENTVSQGSVESGYVDDNSNNSDTAIPIGSHKINDSHIGSWTKNFNKSTKGNAKKVHDDIDQVFCFEDQDASDLIEKSDDLIESENEDYDEPISNSSQKGITMSTRATINTNNNNDSNNQLNSKYSCSVPRSIPTASHFLTGNKIDLDENQKNNIIQEDNDLNENSNLGEAFAQLASSIVYKDGKELFGDRPSRRVPINSISKSCCFDS